MTINTRRTAAITLVAFVALGAGCTGSDPQPAPAPSASTGIGPRTTDPTPGSPTGLPDQPTVEPSLTGAVTDPPVIAGNERPIVIETPELKATYEISDLQLVTQDSQGLKPDRGAWVLGKLTVSVQRGELTACGCDLTLVEADGIDVREQTFSLFEGKTVFEGAHLTAGQKSEGWVAFDVAPADARAGKLRVRNNAFAGDPTFGYWTLTDLR